MTHPFSPSRTLVRDRLLAGLFVCLFLGGCATPEPAVRQVLLPSGGRDRIDFHQTETGVNWDGSLREVVARCNRVWAERPTSPAIYRQLADELATALRNGDYVDLTEQLELAERCMRNARAGGDLGAMRTAIVHQRAAEEGLARIGIQPRKRKEGQNDHPVYAQTRSDSP